MSLKLKSFIVQRTLKEGHRGFIFKIMKASHLVVKPYQKIKPYFPATAFIGGFLWDAYSLGKNIQALDLFILLAYYLGAAAMLPIMARQNLRMEIETLEEQNGFPWKEVPNFLLQFCFGSIFSALVIFYFLSSSYWPSFVFTGTLIFLLVANEFWDKHYHRFTLSWSLFTFAGILYFNFALPHLFHSLNPIWFFISIALGIGITLGVRRLSPLAKGNIFPSYLVGGTMGLLFLFHALPPVPLVKKDLRMARNLEKQAGGFALRIEKPAFWEFWKSTEQEVHLFPGEKLYCYSALFLPSGIDTHIYHEWQYYDKSHKNWKVVSKIGYPIFGGRQNGFRGFTYKQNLLAGDWRVYVKSQYDQVIGITHFSISSMPADSTMAFKEIFLP